MPDPVYLTKARAQQAIDLAEPAITKMMTSGVTNNKAMHIVILGVDGQVLHEQDIGPNVEADAKRLVTSTAVARSKAQLHFRSGRPSLEIQGRRPHSLVVGDTIWGGSTDHEGLIVAASGVQSWFDEAVCSMVADILWGLCMDAQSKHMASPDKTSHYQKPV